MKNNSTKDIWNKRGKDQLGSHAYAAVLGAALTWSVFLVAVGANMTSGWRDGLGLVLLTFIFSIVGIVVFTSSEQPGKSLIGVSILSFFMGMSIGPVLSYYNAAVVIHVLILTFAVTVVMAVVGMLLPNIIAKFSGILFVGLIILMIGYFSASILSIFGISSSFAALDWFSLAIFSLYIWYDWSRAMKLPKSVNNAIDASGALIVDIVNLFMTLIRIVARNQNN